MLQLRLFLVALQFYSRLPVTGRLASWLGHDPNWLAPATRAVWLPPLRPHSIRMSGAVAMRTLYIARSSMPDADWCCPIR